MRQKHIMILAVLLMALASCRGNKEKQTMELLQAAEVDTVTHSMQSSEYTDSVQAWNSLVIYSIHNEPCDSMPVVTDQYGTKFKDNVFVLTIERNGQTVLKRKFTKNDFASLMTAEFRKSGMFDGFRCKNYEDGVLIFSTCVSFPESDMSQPFLVKVRQDGSVTIEQDKTPLNENPADSCIDEEGV